MRLELAIAQKTQDILGNTLAPLGLKNSYSSHWHVTGVQLETELPNFNRGQDLYTFQITIDDQMLETIFTPDSLLAALTKVGALLGLTRIFVLFNMYHQWSFEKAIEKDTNTPASQDSTAPVDLERP